MNRKSNSHTIKNPMGDDGPILELGAQAFGPGVIKDSRFPPGPLFIIRRFKTPNDGSHISFDVGSAAVCGAKGAPTAAAPNVATRCGRPSTQPRPEVGPQNPLPHKNKTPIDKP